MRTLVIACSVVLFGLARAAFAAEQPEPDIVRGVRQCSQGNFHLALESLRTAYAAEAPGAGKARAAGALGLTYLRMGRPQQAEEFLREAYASSGDATERARHGIDLANLLAGRGQAEAARRLYQEAQGLAPNDVSVELSVGLNLARMDGGAGQVDTLSALFALLPHLSDPGERARFAINLGVQAWSAGQNGMRLAYQSLEQARHHAQEAQDLRLGAEALDHLAQLYEDGNRQSDALGLNARGILLAQAADAPELLIRLEWRQGRLQRRLGDIEVAIGAYQRAVAHIETMRVDIPVEYQDGRSSFRETLEPVYLGLADLLLQHSSALGGAARTERLRQARNTVELIKQTELEDFLGDRCSLESVRHQAKDQPIPARTAILYPIILPERLELLVETAGGLQRRTVSVSAEDLRRDVQGYASALRAMQPYQRTARKLYDVLLRPLDDILAQEQVETLVVVPDGVLRLLPFGALHDGQRFAIQKVAIAMVPGLTMTNLQARDSTARTVNALLAGVSEPGAVVDKLPDFMTAQLLAANAAPAAGTSRAVLTRALGKRGIKSAQDNETAGLPAAEKAARSKQLQQILALSGVQDEIETLGRLTAGQTLINQAFSVAAFSAQVQRGDYRIVHIASHGVFGGTAETTFIMAHDDLITIDRLQAFLRKAGKRDQPIELLTLSACETAEGDDRAPLGLTGAALKARARSALGSLWPVADEAAKAMMTEFYTVLLQPGAAKAQALQKAQLRLLDDPAFAHPFFWAPFVIVGGWL